MILYLSGPSGCFLQSLERKDSPLGIVDLMDAEYYVEPSGYGLCKHIDLKDVSVYYS